MPMHARAWLGVALPKVQLRVPLELGEEGAPRQAEPVPGDEELGRWKCPVPLEDDRGSCIFEGDLHFWLAIAGGMRVVEVSCKVRRSWVGRSGRRGGVARETGRGEEMRAEERYQSTFQESSPKRDTTDINNGNLRFDLLTPSSTFFIDTPSIFLS